MVKVAKFIGLDVHKATISVAVAEGGPIQARHLATVAHDIPQVIRLLQREGDPGDIHVAYEAGPTGFGLCRRLREAGFDCVVIAPSKTPVKPGERVKTDRRDALTLAHHLRTNSLTPIEIPGEQREALRDLIRGREDGVRALRAARQQLGGFFLRSGRIYQGRSHWTLQHWAWITSQRFDHEATRIVVADYIQEVHRIEARIASLTKSVDEHVRSSDLAHLYLAYMALRGVSTIVSATLVAELGDLTRFSSAPKLMSFVGLVPSECSSGSRVSRGPITKTGNAHVRRVLVEAAQTYRYRPEVSVGLKRRQKDVPAAVVDIAWKAQKRLHARFKSITGRKKSANYAIVAMARELCGFIWAIGQVVGPKAS
jgi:transposase